MPLNPQAQPTLTIVFSAQQLFLSDCAPNGWSVFTGIARCPKRISCKGAGLVLSNAVTAAFPQSEMTCRRDDERRRHMTLCSDGALSQPMEKP